MPVVTLARPKSGKVKLPYGKAFDGRLLHISEVERGLRCNCVCSSCGKKLVAKKGQKKAHYFAHYATPACNNAYETTLHLLAKQVISERKYVWMPEVIPEYHGKSYTLFHRKCFRPTSVVLELWMDGMRPDIVAQDDKHKSELLVEIYVTHRCGSAKITRIRERKIAAMEIDLSKVSRCAPKEELETAILSSADRIWLFNSKQEAAENELRAEVAREAKEAQERERRRITSEADHLIAVLRRTEKQRVIQPSKEMEIKMAEVADAGLSEHVGIQGADSGCFSVISRIWQTAIMHRFVLRSWGARYFSLPEVRDFLLTSDFILPEFSGRIEFKIADAIRASVSSFLSPWEATHRYLKFLSDGKLIDYDSEGNGYGRPEVTSNAQWKVENAKASRQRVALIRVRLDGLLSRLPGGDSINTDLWMQHIHSGYSESPIRLAHESYGEYSKFIDHLGRLEKMLSTGPVVEGNLLGLPMENQLKARKHDHRRAEEQARRLKVEQAQKNAEDIRLAALKRKIDLVNETNFHLGIAKGQFWLSRALPCLAGESVESCVGLTEVELRSALVELRRETVRQNRESERREFTQILLNEAIACCDRESGEQWMRLNNSFLGNRKPVEVCVNAVGLEECRNALKQFTRRNRRRK